MSKPWIPKVGERVSIVDQPGWTGDVRQVIHRGENILVRLMPHPPHPARPQSRLPRVTEDVVYLENLSPYRSFGH